VYWVRRLLVLGVAFALVFGLGRLLGGDGAADETAQPASATGTSTQSARPTATTTAQAPEGRIPADDQKRRGGDRPAKTRTPLAMPTGACSDSDVRVRPVLRETAYAGGDVRLTLRLTTSRSPACTWSVSPETVAVKLTSGSDRIWSSQECPSSVPEQDVVLRDNRPTEVDVTWSGRRSDPDCSRTTQWAEPGYYHVTAAALGSEPEDQQFRLVAPAPVTITPTPTPRREGDEKR
jgi:hypothetical protein